MWPVEAMDVVAFRERVGKYVSEGFGCVFIPRRDFGGHQDRQKARLMWLVEAMGMVVFQKKGRRVHN